MTMIFRRLWLVSLISLSLALPACVGRVSEPTRFYLLTAQPPAASPEGTAPETVGRVLNIEIAPVELPLYLNRPQIVTRTGPNRILPAESHHWGGNLTDNINRVVMENLSQALPAHRVYSQSPRLATVPDLRLLVDVLHFEAGIDGQVALAARWRFAAAARGGRSPALWRRSLLTASASGPIPGAAANPAPPSISEPEAFSGSGYDAIVATMSALLAQLSQEIASEARRWAAEAEAEPARVPGVGG